MRTKMDLLEAMVMLLASAQGLIELTDDDKAFISMVLRYHAIKEET